MPNITIPSHPKFRKTSMYPSCASRGCHQYMLHILSRRFPSQKLSKPVPTTGFPDMPSTSFQMSVRPVSVGSRPMECRMPDPMSRKRVLTDTENIASTIKCTTQGLRATKRRLVVNMRALASKKQDRDVIEWAIQSSHDTIVRQAPKARSCLFLAAPCALRQAVSKRQTKTSPRTRQRRPSSFLLVVTPV